MPDYNWQWNGNTPSPTSAMPVLQPGLEKPYPDGIWRIDENNGGAPYTHKMMSILYVEPTVTLGAFEDAASLASVRVPISVKTIGPTAFKGTALQRVKIAADCTYEETSFPEGCVVTRYPDDRYDQLYDCDGKAVLDCDGARVYVLKEDISNG